MKVDAINSPPQLHQRGCIDLKWCDELRLGIFAVHDSPALLRSLRLPLGQRPQSRAGLLDLHAYGRASVRKSKPRGGQRIEKVAQVAEHNLRIAAGPLAPGV